MRILYDLDPEGMGIQRRGRQPGVATLGAKTESEESQEIRSRVPTAEKGLIDALWAARQEIA
jgi:hypothetical protein